MIIEKRRGGGGGREREMMFSTIANWVPEKSKIVATLKPRAKLLALQ